MTTTEQQLRADLELMQHRFVSLCDVTRMSAQLIYGAAGNGKAEEAAELTAQLLQDITTAKHQFVMRQEKANGYDLAALRVDATSASNSETGWED